jgi:hypothetical protein
MFTNPNPSRYFINNVNFKKKFKIIILKNFRPEEVSHMKRVTARDMETALAILG